MDVKIEESWKAVLREEFDKEYFSRIAACRYRRAGVSVDLLVDILQ